MDTYFFHEKNPHGAHIQIRYFSLLFCHHLSLPGFSLAHWDARIVKLSSQHQHRENDGHHHRCVYDTTVNRFSILAIFSSFFSPQVVLCSIESHCHTQLKLATTGSDYFNNFTVENHNFTRAPAQHVTPFRPCLYMFFISDMNTYTL